MQSWAWILGTKTLTQLLQVLAYLRVHVRCGCRMEARLSPRSWKFRDRGTTFTLNFQPIMMLMLSNASVEPHNEETNHFVPHREIVLLQKLKKLHPSECFTVVTPNLVDTSIRYHYPLIAHQQDSTWLVTLSQGTMNQTSHLINMINK